MLTTKPNPAETSEQATQRTIDQKRAAVVDSATDNCPQAWADEVESTTSRFMKRRAKAVRGK